MGVFQSGDIYKYDRINNIACVDFYHHLSQGDNTSSAKKVKVKWLGSYNSSTKMTGPDVFKAYYWFSNNGVTYSITRSLF